MRNLIIIFAVVCIHICHAIEFNGKITMTVNGHEYFLDDAIGKGFIDLWVENRDTLRKVLEQDEDIQEVRLPINPSYIEYKMDQDYSDRITVALGVKNIFLNIKLGS